MADVCGGGSMPPLRPITPPEMPDLGGKRRRMAKVQKLEREIGFLQEELKTVGEIQPASRSCKEISDFVGTKTDPLMPTKHRKNRNTSCGFWGWLCGMGCFNSWCFCCSYRSECSCQMKCPACCLSCSRSVFRCSSSCCCGDVSCSRKRCVSGSPSCQDCSCCRDICSCFSCLKMGLCCCCCCCRNYCHSNSHPTPTSH